MDCPCLVADKWFKEGAESFLVCFVEFFVADLWFFVFTFFIFVLQKFTWSYNSFLRRLGKEMTLEWRHTRYSPPVVLREFSIEINTFS